MAEALRIVTIVGARPQFIKAAAVSRAISAHNRDPKNLPTLDEIIIHTGQHYDENMSRIFFDELQIPEPARNLGVGSDSHGRQTAAMLEAIECILLEEKPDWVLIYGDTNSTLAGAIAASKLHIPVAHVEAGLRSFNRRMPEEINRILADRVSSLLLCPTRTASKNLADEGITDGVRETGDVMYDSVLFNTALAERRSRILSELSLAPKSFALATVHRAENTDDPDRINGILNAFARIDLPIVLPLHPRTRQLIGRRIDELSETVRVIEPVGYLDMLVLEKNARVILTDSGGIQKEAYFFDVPCVTLRDETEWVELVEIGANKLAGSCPDRILAAYQWAVDPSPGAVDRSPVDASHVLYGDGHAGERIVAAMIEFEAD